MLIWVVNSIIVYCTYESSGYGAVMTDMYEDPQNIDILLLGSSHTDVSFDEKYMNQAQELHVFNAGSPVQKPDTSYYILKETSKSNSVKQVYLDMFYYMYQDEPQNRTNAQLEFIYIITDQMKWSWDKIEFLLNAGPMDSYIHGFIKASRTADNILYLTKTEQLIKEKRHSDNDDIASEKVEEIDIHNTYDIPNVCIGNSSGYRLQKQNISEYSRKYIKKIAKLCRDKGIELVLVATPMTDYQLNIIGDYDTYINEVKSLAESIGVPYRDYNLCNEEILGITDDCFADMHHLNKKGSRIFTIRFMEYETGQLSYDDTFYQSYRQKINSMKDTCFGIDVISTGENNEYQVVPVCNRKMDLLYEISQQEEQLVNVLSIDNNIFRINKSGIYNIIVKNRQNDEVLKRYEIELNINEME